VTRGARRGPNCASRPAPRVALCKQPDKIRISRLLLDTIQSVGNGDQHTLYRRRRRLGRSAAGSRGGRSGFCQAFHHRGARADRAGHVVPGQLLCRSNSTLQVFLGPSRCPPSPPVSRPA
jgi:hypothetical protein